MILPLTPAILALAYDYLCAHKPFAQWKMPHSEEVVFAIFKRTDRYAEYQYDNDKHQIRISSRLVGSHATLLSTMAHEMIHLHLNAKGCFDMRSPHGADFHKLADRVCKIHSFDRLTF